jgi:hypothetical protein
MSAFSAMPQPEISYSVVSFAQLLTEDAPGVVQHRRPAHLREQGINVFRSVQMMVSQDHNGISPGKAFLQGNRLNAERRDAVWRDYEIMSHHLSDSSPKTIENRTNSSATRVIRFWLALVCKACHENLCPFQVAS